MAAPKKKKVVAKKVVSAKHPTVTTKAKKTERADALLLFVNEYARF